MSTNQAGGSSKQVEANAGRAMHLSQEQKRRIEENKAKALAIRAAKHQFQSPQQSTNILPSRECEAESRNHNVKTVNSALFRFSNRSNSLASTCQKSGQANHPSFKVSPMKNTTYHGAKHKKPLRATCVLVARNTFEVKSDFSQKLIDIFKQTPGKNYNANTRIWNFPLSSYSNLVQAMHSLSPEIEVVELPKAVCEVFLRCQQEKEGESIPRADLSIIDEKLTSALMPFQEEAVHFGVSRQGTLLIADDMGLGKTIQALCIACYYRAEWPLLIVCPSSVRFTWADAIQRWVPSVPPDEINVVVSGKNGLREHLITILTYDLLTRQQQTLSMQNYQVVILDESHSLKSYKAQRTKAAMLVVKKSKRKILLSGTPALSRPEELYTQISIINNKMFRNFTEFGIRYCDGKENKWGWDFSGASHMAELELLLKETLMIRRLKSDVLDQLPAKTRQMVVLDSTIIDLNCKSLKSAAKEMRNISLKGMERRGALLSYFHETCRAKVKAVLDYVKYLVTSGKKLLVFAHHKVMIDHLREMLESQDTSFICIDGHTSGESRKVMMDKFQVNDSYKVALLSITAASTGITLTAASLVVFAELFWNPGILVQAEDRAHRVGQKDSVLVQYLVAQGTADDWIWPLVQRKLDILNRAGLSKDNFSDAATTTLENPNQKTLFDYWEDLGEMSEENETEASSDSTLTIDSSIAYKKQKLSN